MLPLSASVTRRATFFSKSLVSKLSKVVLVAVKPGCLLISVLCIFKSLRLLWMRSSHFVLIAAVDYGRGNTHTVLSDGSFIFVDFVSLNLM